MFASRLWLRTFSPVQPKYLGPLHSKNYNQPQWSVRFLAKNSHIDCCNKRNNVYWLPCGWSHGRLQVADHLQRKSITLQSPLQGALWCAPQNGCFSMESGLVGAPLWWYAPRGCPLGTIFPSAESNWKCWGLICQCGETTYWQHVWTMVKCLSTLKVVSEQVVVK